MGDHVETERKFDVSFSFLLPDFGTVAAVTSRVRHHLVATYYDTQDLRLAANRITLRRRTGGADEGWHLKLPKGGHSRLELHAEAGPSADPAAPAEVPARLSAEVAAVTAGLSMSPVAVLVTERAGFTLTSPAGEPAAEVADDTVTARKLPQDAEPLHWREVEVELIGTDHEIFNAAVRLLTEAGATPSPATSKLAKLLPTPP